MTEVRELARIELAVDALLTEIVEFDMGPRALALKGGLLEDRVRAVLLDAVVLLGERLRRKSATPRSRRSPRTSPRVRTITTERDPGGRLDRSEDGQHRAKARRIEGRERSWLISTTP
jgi:hypothetical protein